MSRVHAKLVTQDVDGEFRFTLHDNASTNGLSVNGTRIGSCELR